MTRLEVEATCLYKLFSDSAVSEYILSSYAQATDQLGLAGSTLENEWIGTVIDKNLDIEAVEFANRLRFGRSLLSKKIHLMSFLVETEGANAKIFINDVERRPTAIARMSFEVGRTIWKALKGFYLVWRYNLV